MLLILSHCIKLLFNKQNIDSYDEKLKALIYFGDLPNSSLSNDDYVEIDNNTFNATNNLEGLKVAAIGRGFLLRSNAVLVDTNNQFQNQILSGVKNYSIYDIHNPTIVGGTIINLMSTKRFYLSDAIPDPVDKSAGDVAVMFNKTEQILGRECIISPYNEIAWWKFGQMDMSDDIATTASTPPTQGRYKRNGQYMMVGGRPAFYYGTIWRDGEGNNFSALRTGTSASRPQNVQPGYVYFDSTIGKPIWYKGNGIWVNESGQSV